MTTTYEILRAIDASSDKRVSADLLAETKTCEEHVIERASGAGSAEVVRLSRTADGYVVAHIMNDHFEVWGWGASFVDVARVYQHRLGHGSDAHHRYPRSPTMAAP